MKRSRGLHRLAVAAEVLLERRVLALRQLDEAAVLLQIEAEALRRAPMDPQRMLEVRGEAAHVVAAWEVLRDRRLAGLRRREANLAAAREDARVEIARAWGRAAAIRRLTR